MFNTNYNKYSVCYIGPILIVIFIIMASCHRRSSSTIDTIFVDHMNADELSFDSVVASVEITPLEKTDHSLVGPINGFCFVNDKYYVLDAILVKGVLVFDKSGKYINTFRKHGRGPEEYISMRSFLVDAESKTIEIYSYDNRTIYIYDIETFAFIQKHEIGMRASSFVKKNGKYYIQTNQIRNVVNNKETNADIIVYDPVSGGFETIFEKLLPVDPSNRTLEIDNIFFKTQDDRLYVNRLFVDTLFSLNGIDAVPRYIIDHNGLFYKNVSYKEFPEKEKEFLRGTMGQCRIVQIHDDNIILSYMYDAIFEKTIFEVPKPPRIGYIIYSSQTRKTLTLRGLKGSMVDLSYFLPTNYTSEGIIVVISPPFNELNEGVKKLYGLTEDSNPVLVKITLRTDIYE